MTYADVVQVLDSLPLILREARRERGLSQRAACQEAGMNVLAFQRAEKGDPMTITSARSFLLWLDRKSADVSPETSAAGRD